MALASGKERFEAFCLKADILIELRRYDEAVRVLEELRTKFASYRGNVQLGLSCKLNIRRGEWRQAEIVWEKLTNKDEEISIGMRRQIYELKVNDTSLSLSERKQAQDEIALLHPDLRDVSVLFSHDDPLEG